MLATARDLVQSRARPVPPPLPSPLAGVPDAAWDRLVRALCRAPLVAVSPIGLLGCFEQHPQRLAEVGVAVSASRDGRVWSCEFAPPLARDLFLASHPAQYAALVRSVVAYDAEIAAGKVTLPAGVSRSGAHAVLHRAGRDGLAGWSRRKLPETRVIFDLANGIF